MKEVDDRKRELAGSQPFCKRSETGWKNQERRRRIPRFKSVVSQAGPLQGAEIDTEAQTLDRW
jgi:hypothetical protein